MKVILVISFIYMSLHLLKYSFKKGEELAFKREEYVYPMAKAALFKNSLLYLWALKVKTLSGFKGKYKMVAVEMEKEYTATFTKDFISLLSREKHTEDIIELIYKIFEYKQKVVYKNFKFSDDFEISRFSQFWTVRNDISKHRLKNIIAVVYTKYQNGALNLEEEKEWIPRFEQVGLIEQEIKTEEINYVGETINEVKEVKEETEEVILRDVSKKRVARFDSAKQIIRDKNKRVLL